MTQEKRTTVLKSIRNLTEKGGKIIVIEPSTKSEYGDIVYPKTESWYEIKAKYYDSIKEDILKHLGKPVQMEKDLKVPYIFPNIDEATKWITFNITDWHLGELSAKEIQKVREQLLAYQCGHAIRLHETSNYFIFNN